RRLCVGCWKPRRSPRRPCTASWRSSNSSAWALLQSASVLWPRGRSHTWIWRRIGRTTWSTGADTSIAAALHCAAVLELARDLDAGPVLEKRGRQSGRRLQKVRLLTGGATFERGYHGAVH